jgi:hypothetical protein
MQRPLVGTCFAFFGAVRAILQVILVTVVQLRLPQVGESYRKIEQTLLRAVNKWFECINSTPVTPTAQHHLEQRKVAAMGKSMLHGFAITIVVVAAALGSAAIATDAVARGGGGTGHGGGGVGGGHFGAAMGGSHFGGGMVRGFSGGHFSGGRLAEQGRRERARSGAVPFGYYDDWDNGYYDPSPVTPDEQPSGPTTPYAYVKPPRSSCTTQTYKVPSEAGGEASIKVVRC